MDIKTGYGFILIAMALALEIASTAWGFNGAIDEIVKGLIASGIMALGLKGIYDTKK